MRRAILHLGHFGNVASLDDDGNRKMVSGKQRMLAPRLLIALLMALLLAFLCCFCCCSFEYC